jgi:CubicO group peptidase (beta-lactamase class C family)
VRGFIPHGRKASVQRDRRSPRAHGLAFACILLLLASAAARAQAPPDSTIRRMLSERLAANQGVAIVVGVIDADGRHRVVAAQKPGVDEAAPGAASVFEIGSITKVFTAILLAEMAERDQLRLNDPLDRHLPDSVNVPSRNGRAITLEQLAAHTSGLPRLPGNMRITDMADPYADYSVAQMYAFLNAYELARDPGEKSEYSNFGAGVLGHALALRADTSYEALVNARILTPLAMSSTAIALSADMRARLARGHNANGDVVANWHLPALAGAGALRSTVDDMLKFLAANIDPDTSTTLGRAMAVTQIVRAPVADNLRIGLGWHMLQRGSRTIIWHNGGTGGYRSFIGFDPERDVGVVVLSNTNISVDDLGVTLLVGVPPS